MKNQKSQPLYLFDNAIRRKGYPVLAGVDEAGRGPWAGPVIAACVVLPDNMEIEGLDDSKALTATQRESLYHKIVEIAVAIGLGEADNRLIDSINILQSTFAAMRRAVGSLLCQPSLVLVDGSFTIPELDLPQNNVIKGDSISAVIAAASIIAKVTRDKIMKENHKKYPNYEFAQHKGYGTKLHRERLNLHGPCEIHRLSFAPVKEIAAKN